MHLFAKLLQRAATMPDAIFCHLAKGEVFEDISVGAIVHEAHQFARLLGTFGVREGEIVPIMLEHGRMLYSSFIGCTLIGAVPTFLPPLTRKQDPVAFRAATERLFGRIAPRCAIVSGATSASLAGIDVACLHVEDVAGTPLDSLLADTAERLSNLPLGRGEAPAFLQHSSGTTGHKKGVRLSHKMVLRQIELYAEATGVGPRDVVASWLPVYHDMGLITSFLLPSVCGLPIVSLDALEWVSRPTTLLDAIARYRATMCWLPNFAFPHIVRMAEPEATWDLSSLRLLVNCSEPCRTAAVDGFAERFATSALAPTAIQASYAMAETVFAVTQTPIGQPVRRATQPDTAQFLSSGRPLPGTIVRILDEAGRDVPEGTLGEILISCETMFAGYHNLPELSAQRLQNGWYRSGDLGYLDQGELFVIGRNDDVLNINGKKLIAHEIEADLNILPGVAPGRTLVFTEHDDAAGAAHLVVAVEPREDLADAAASLSGDVRRAVVSNCGLRPNRVMVLERGFLLKSTSGKISRQASIEKLERTISHKAYP